jgi:hypothetical protein
LRKAALASAVLGGAALVAGLAAAPANAQSATSPTFDPQHATAHQHPLVGGNYNEDGGNWSGYVATGGSFTSVSATWNEPTVTCNSSSDLYAPWVGIDGYGSGSVEQTGVQADCSSGSPEYSAWYEMYPDSPQYYNDPVSGGDSFTGTVTTDGNGNYTLTLKDDTQGWTESTPGSYQGENASAEAILESPTAAYPNFGEVDFTGFSINGQDASAYSPVALDASNSSGFEDHTSALSGGSFSVSYSQE